MLPSVNGFNDLVLHVLHGAPASTVPHAFRNSRFWLV